MLLESCACHDRSEPGTPAIGSGALAATLVGTRHITEESGEAVSGSMDEPATASLVSDISSDGYL